MTNVVERLEAKARQSFGHGMFAELRKLMPADQQRDPRAVLSWLRWAAAQDPVGAERPEYAAAEAAYTELVSAHGLVERLSAIYHDPKVQLAAGDKLDWYLDHPQAAYEALLANPSLLPGDLRNEVMLASREAQDLAAGLPQETAPAAPLPREPAKAEAEYKALLKESIDDRRHFGPDKQARLEALAGMKASREAGAADAVATPKQPGEYERLVKKSVSGALGPAEHARLEQLAGDRAVAEGRVSPDDLAAERAVAETTQPRKEQ